MCAEDITQCTLVRYLPDKDSQMLIEKGTLPPESSAWGRHCVMCPVKAVCVRIGVTYRAVTSLIWVESAHVTSRFLTLAGRSLSCHTHTLKTMWCFLLGQPLDWIPGMLNMIVGSRYPMGGRRHPHPDGVRPHGSTYLWKSTHGSQQAQYGGPEHPTRGLREHTTTLGMMQSRPTINLFELWENGSRMLKLVAGRNYWFPKPLVVACAWIKSPSSLSLRDDISRGRINHKGPTPTHHLGIWSPFPKSTEPFAGFHCE